jgi:hypothetical protein
MLIGLISRRAERPYPFGRNWIARDSEQHKIIIGRRRVPAYIRVSVLGFVLRGRRNVYGNLGLAEPVWIDTAVTDDVGTSDYQAGRRYKDASPANFAANMLAYLDSDIAQHLANYALGL